MISVSSAPANSDLVIEAGQVFDGERFLGARRVEIRNGRISAVLAAGRELETDTIVTLPPDVVLAPGFIDLQANGGGDVLLNAAPSLAAISRIAAAHRRFGTTGLLPTLISDHPDTLAQLLSLAADGLSVPGVLGYHLEGPHLNPARKGIHPAQHIRPVEAADIAILKRFAEFGRSLVTLAPECVAPHVIAELAASGLHLAVGHSDATAAQVLAAADHGLTGVTHLFNAMAQMHPREPGVVGAAMADKRLFAGIICDGLHVAPLSLQAAFNAMGRDRLMLVSDAMPTVGGTMPCFKLQDRTITLQDGRLTDAQGTLAGAHLTMIGAVQNAVTLMGVSLADALVMASRTPARFLGLEQELGRISTGYRADCVAFGHDYAVRATWIAGAGR